MSLDDLHPKLHPELSKPIVWGSLTASYKENSVVGVQVDRLAHSGRELNLLSCVAPAQKMKALRAILHTKNGKPMITTCDCKTKFPIADGVYNGSYARDLSPSKWGYAMYMERLEHGLVHAVFITRDPGFIVYLDPESLWQKLKTDAFTTPLLREWMPWLTQQLIARNMLSECKCMRCNSAMLSIANEKVLDKVVCHGIQSGALVIPE